MKKKICVRNVLLFVLISLFLFPVALSASGSFISQNPSNPSEYQQAIPLYFTGTSSDPGNLYLDAYANNPDVGIELCDLGTKYVGAFYAMNVAGSWRNALVTYSSSNTAFGQTTEDTGGGCYATVPGFITVSPSDLTTPNPDVKKAALPGNLWIGHATNSNPGSVTDFVYSEGDAKFRGGYTVPRTFSSATRQITLSTPEIQFQTSSTTFSKSADDDSFGVSSERPLVLGVCDDATGVSCSAGQVLTSPTFPLSFDSGLSSGQINDQQTHTKYAVLNSLGQQMCIGANLNPILSSVSPDPIYYSQTLNMQFSVRNPRDSPFELRGGNVDVTTPFNVRVQIYETSNPANVVYSNSQTVSSSVSVDETIPFSLNWPALEHSGTYTVEVELDTDDDIVECDETDNIATTTFELLPITMPEIFIDGVNTDEFPRANEPYNVTFHLENSDGDILNDANVILTEKNGLNLAVPTQTYDSIIDSSLNTEQRGIISVSQARFKTDYYGNTSFTFIPTFDKLYDGGFGVDLEDHVGNYSLSFTGNQSDGENFKFIRSGNLTSDYLLTINQTNYTGSYTTKNLPHQTMVMQVLDYAYHVYTNFINTITN
ncbi:MAG: CARDB domain-containing protein [Nanobdellota archaeon]